MVAKKPAKTAARKPAGDAATRPPCDDGENIALMEPMLVPEDSSARARISELAFELSKASAAFRASVPIGLTAPLADLVRSMNCYYSNLIEGHNTHPVDIEKAIHNDLSEDPKKRDLQLEAKAHIAVQRWIDESNLDGRELSTQGLFEIHRQFTSLLPDDLQWVEDPPRLTAMLSSLGSEIAAKEKAVNTRIVALEREAHEAAERLSRLYQPIEDSVAEMDDILKDRITALKLDRNRVQEALARARIGARPSVEVSPIVVEQFGQTMRQNLTTSEVPFRKAYLGSLVDRVEMDDHVVRIVGRKDVLKQAVLANGDPIPGGRSFVRKWRSLRESNPSFQIENLAS